MKLLDLLKISLLSLDKNRTRALLTMLGIIIGVASVIAMLAIGKGSDESIRNQITSLGTNMIMVLPGSTSEGGRNMGSGTSASLKLEDVDAIEKYSKLVTMISPSVQTRAQLIYASNNWNTSIMGVYSDYLQITNYKISHGTMFDEKAGKSLQKICVIGKTVADNLFSSPNEAIGKTIRINKIPFIVTGVLAEKGQGSFGQNQDDLILTPFKTVQRRLMGINHVQIIYLSAINENKINETMSEVETILIEKQNKLKGDAPDFSLRSLSEITNMLGSITKVLTILLASISSISLLVGGIGIMNIMLVSVTERTKEIGLRLAVGAPQNAILLQFLAESIVMSLVGGFIGILLGYGIASMVSQIMGWPVEVTVNSILLAFGFSYLIGIVFGYFPALKASRLNPIEALRYE